jgi:hypothetical protein
MELHQLFQAFIQIPAEQEDYSPKDWWLESLQRPHESPPPWLISNYSPSVTESCNMAEMARVSSA